MALFKEGQMRRAQFPVHDLPASPVELIVMCRHGHR
jgi:hypothetical protein